MLNNILREPLDEAGLRKDLAYLIDRPLPLQIQDSSDGWYNMTKEWQVPIFTEESRKSLKRELLIAARLAGYAPFHRINHIQRKRILENAVNQYFKLHCIQHVAKNLVRREEAKAVFLDVFDTVPAFWERISAPYSTQELARMKSRVLELVVKDKSYTVEEQFMYSWSTVTLEEYEETASLPKTYRYKLLESPQG